MPIEDTKVVTVDSKTNYDVPKSLDFLRKVGSGAYGTVASFKSTVTGMNDYMHIAIL